MSDKLKIESADMPAGGWGSVREVTNILFHEHVPLKDSRLLLKQNKPDGYACVSCAWAKPANPHPFEFCESGAKATAWETTSRAIGAEQGNQARLGVTRYRRLGHHADGDARRPHRARLSLSAQS